MKNKKCDTTHLEERRATMKIDCTPQELKELIEKKTTQIIFKADEQKTETVFQQSDELYKERSDIK